MYLASTVQLILQQALNTCQVKYILKQEIRITPRVQGTRVLQGYLSQVPGLCDQYFFRLYFRRKTERLKIGRLYWSLKQKNFLINCQLHFIYDYLRDGLLCFISVEMLCNTAFQKIVCLGRCLKKDDIWESVYLLLTTGGVL